LIKSTKDTPSLGISNIISKNVSSPYPYPRVTPTNDLIYDHTDKYIPPTGIVS